MENLDIDVHMTPQDDGYYHQYIRLYLANVALTAQVKELVIEKNVISSRLSKYQDEDGYSSCDKNHQKNKRFRRTAHEIERFYKCIVKNCEKSYGSQGSLNQHYKLKHPQIYVTLPNVLSAKSQADDDFNDDQSCFSQKENFHFQKQNIKLTAHNIPVNDCEPLKIQKKLTSIENFNHFSSFNDQNLENKNAPKRSSRVRKSSILGDSKQNYYY